MGWSSLHGLTSHMDTIGEHKDKEKQRIRHFSPFCMTTVTQHHRRTVDLPMAPVTGSHVPWLTSIHSTPARGPYGDARYPGNCGGYLIRDLILYFKPHAVLDPMTGSGTCRDVCRELNVPCRSFDVKAGFDASDSRCYENIGAFDFIWLHPPYWRMKVYGDDPRCLSNAPSVHEFHGRLRNVVENCVSVLAPGGKIAILMGDYRDQGMGRYMPLTHMTRDVCLRLGLWPACTDIIRFQHGNSSSKKRYSASFIPGLHDTCIVMERR